jgi:hypothetical protein
VRSFTARATGSAAGHWSFHYRVEGGIHRLRVPPPAAPAQSDGLWRQTCFEAFVKPAGAAGYLELNFAPSGAWAIYAFDDYRRGMQPRTPRTPPEIVTRQSAGVLELDARVAFEGLFTESPPADDLRLALAAVLEDAEGRLSYWALAHPSERPDFHHPHSFVLELPLGTAK